MARLFLISLYACLAALVVSAKSAASARAKSSGLIPFVDFDSGSHSYSIEFIIDHEDHAWRFYDGKMHTAPLKIFEGIVDRCTQLGNISSPAMRETNQMLVATKWQRYGVDFLYTDAIDYNDPMQACIQNIGKQSMQWKFEAVAGAKTEIDPENEIAQTVKEAAARKSGGAAIQVQLRPLPWVAMGALLVGLYL